MKFITKARWLTPYALACGYIETVDSDRFSLTLRHSGGVGYHVKMHDHDEGRRICWDTYETLTVARKHFLELCRAYGLTRRKNN